MVVLYLVVFNGVVFVILGSMVFLVVLVMVWICVVRCVVFGGKIVCVLWESLLVTVG